jgi:acyl carrier protein
VNHVSTEDRVTDLIADNLRWGGTRSELAPDFPLIENHVIDSLGMLTLVSALEDEFGIDVEDEDLVPDNFGTIGQIAAFVDGKRS